MDESISEFFIYLGFYVTFNTVQVGEGSVLKTANHQVATTNFPT